MENKELNVEKHEQESKKSFSWKWLLLIVIVLIVIGVFVFGNGSGVGLLGGYKPPVNQSFSGQVMDNYPAFDKKDDKINELYEFKYENDVEDGKVETVYLPKAENVILENGFVSAEIVDKGVFAAGYSVPLDEWTDEKMVSIIEALPNDIISQEKEWTHPLKLLLNEDVVYHKESQTWMKLFVYYTGGANLMHVTFVNKADNWSISDYEFALRKNSKESEIKVFNEMLKVNGFDYDCSSIYSSLMN